MRRGIWNVCVEWQGGIRSEMNTLEGQHEWCRSPQQMTEERRKWYGHVMRMKEEHIVRGMLDVEITGKRRRGWPNLRWQDACNGLFMARCVAHLSPDTVTGDDGRQQPDTSNDTAESVGWSGTYSTGSKKWHRYLRCSHSAPSRWTPCDLSSGLSSQQRLSDAVSEYLVHLRSPRRWLLVPCKHIVNSCRATTAVSWRPTSRWQICRLNRP